MMSGTAHKLLSEWCKSRSIPYELIRNESQLRAYYVAKEHKNKAQHLVKYAKTVAREHNMHSFHFADRGGVLSIISENIIDEEIANGVIDDMLRRHNEFVGKLEEALLTEDTPEKTQYKWTSTAPVEEPGDQPEKFSKKKKKDEPKEGTRAFNSMLDEALGGIATPTGMQPEDGISAIKSALKAMNAWQEMKKMGVSVKFPDDGSKHMMTFIRNEVPVLSIPTAEVAEKDKLAKLIDRLGGVLKGQAPEHNEMMRDAAATQKKQADAIATKFGRDPEQELPTK